MLPTLRAAGDQPEADPVTGSCDCAQSTIPNRVDLVVE